MLTENLIIFDCDGVLVDSEYITCSVVAENLSNYGLKLTPEKAMDLFVGGTMIGVGEQAKLMGANIPDNWIDEIYSQIYARLKEGVEPIAGIVKLLQSLRRQKIDFCVASNGSEEKMQITLGGNNLLDFFDDRIFSAHTVGIAKPNPGLFLHAAKQMGYKPENCIVIEDSQSGVKAAIAAGMQCYGYCEHGQSETLASLGAIPFKSMSNLLELIGSS